jgi:hypothetical protein
MHLDPRDAAIHCVCVNDPRSGKSPPKDTRGISFTMILHYNLVQSAAHAGRRQYSCPATNQMQWLRLRLTPKNLDVRVVLRFLSRQLHLALRTVEAKSEKPRPQNDVVKADI